MSGVDNNATSSSKSTANRGRRRQGTLHQLDGENEQRAQAQQSGEQQEAIADGEGIVNDQSVEQARANQPRLPSPSRERRARSPSPEAANFSSGSSSDSEQDSSDSSSSDSEDERRKRPKKKAKKAKQGLLEFKRNTVITVANKGSLRQIGDYFKKVAGLMDKIDRTGKFAFRDFISEGKDHRRFLIDVLEAVRRDTPKNHAQLKSTISDIKTVKECLNNLLIEVDPSSEMPQWGYHILDWCASSSLQQCIGERQAQRVHTAVKGQKKTLKALFKKSPEEVYRSWLSRHERSKNSQNDGQRSSGNRSGFGNNRGGRGNFDYKRRGGQGGQEGPEAKKQF